MASENTTIIPPRAWQAWGSRRGWRNACSCFVTLRDAQAGGGGKQALPGLAVPHLNVERQGTQSQRRPAIPGAAGSNEAVTGARANTVQW